MKSNARFLTKRPQTLYLIVQLHGMDLSSILRSPRSISTNCKVNSDIQTASIISKTQGTGWHNRSNTSLVLNGEERHFWIMSKMSQEDCLTCHVYLLSTLDSKAFNQPSSSLQLAKFAAWHDQLSGSVYTILSWKGPALVHLLLWAYKKAHLSRGGAGVFDGTVLWVDRGSWFEVIRKSPVVTIKVAGRMRYVSITVWDRHL